MTTKDLVLALLLAANLTGVGILLVKQGDRQVQYQTESPSSRAQLTEAQIQQLDKINTLANDFQTELEVIQGRTAYPDDKAREGASTWMQGHKFVFEQGRLLYLKTKSERTTDAIAKYLSFAWNGDTAFSMGLISEVRYPFAKWNAATSTQIPYPNANFSKLDSMNNEFRVLTLSLMKELK